MLRYIERMISLEELKYLPVYVYEDMPPHSVIRTFESTVKMYEKLGLEDKFFRKVRLIYLKPGQMKAAWFFISKDRNMVDIDKLISISRADDLTRWYDESMNKHIIKILPADEVKSFPLPIPKSIDADMVALTVKKYMERLESEGIPKHLLSKVRTVTDSAVNMKKYVKYRRFFYVDEKIIYIDTQDCHNGDDLDARVKSVKDWWMLQKLQDF